MNKLLLGIIVLLSIFIRFYQLGAIPSGLTNDEANIGFDAYSIYKTGHDQWNRFLPLTSFTGFGDNRPPVYYYFVAPSIAIFGLNEYAVRFPSAIFGVFLVILVYYFGKLLVNEKVALIASFLLAISPWAIGVSRISLEPIPAMCFVLLGLFFFLKTKNNYKAIYPSVVFFILSVYTYSAYTLFVPLIFITIFFFYKKELFKIKKHVLIALILFFVSLAPLLFNGSPAVRRFSSVGITNDVTSLGIINILNHQRGSCLKEFSDLFCKLMGNKVTLFSSTFLKNYVSHFSYDFLYINGTTTQFSILPKRGLQYSFESIFLLLGLVVVILSKRREQGFLLSILFMAPIPDSLTGPGNYARAFLMMPFLVLIEALGFSLIIDYIRSIKFNFIKSGLFVFINVLFLYSVSSFFVIYLTYFRDHYSQASEYGYKELMEFVDVNKNAYDKIYIAKYGSDTKQYIYYLFFSKYDPSKFKSKINVDYHTNTDSWISIDRIDNIYFVDNVKSIYADIHTKENILLASSPKEIPSGAEPLKVIKDRVGNEIFRIVELKGVQEFLHNK